MSSADKDSSCLLLWSLCLYFLLLPPLEWSRISSNMSDKTRYFTMFQILGEKHSVFYYYIWCKMQFFCSLGSLPLIYYEFLSWPGIKYYQMFFISVCDDNVIFFLLWLVNMVDHIDWFSNIKPSLPAWINLIFHQV